MRRFFGNLFYALLGLFILLAVLVAVLHFSGRHLPSPLSNVARVADNLITP